MKISTRRAGTVAAWAVAATVAFAAAAGAATSVASASPRPAPSGSAATPNSDAADLTDSGGVEQGDVVESGTVTGRDGKARKRVGPAAHRGIHGEFVVKKKDGTYVTLDAQRGLVTAVSATSVTVRSVDGFTKIYVLNSHTKVRADRQKSDLSAVKTGATVGIVGVKTSSTVTAKAIRVHAAGK